MRKDEGHEETEKVLKELEAKINKEYKQAEKELTEKIDDYLRRFAVKDNLKRQAVMDGMITEEEYEKWRVGQIAIGERWTEMRDSIAQDLANTAQIAKSISNAYMPEVYAINHNYGTFQVEKESLVDTSYTLYDRSTVQRLFNDEIKLYKKPSIRIQQQIKMGKQVAWDKKQVQSAMMQSLLQGESIGKIATRLSKTVGESDRKAAIRNARTMTTGVQNAGRVDSYKRAEDMGIKLMQEWLATLDGRTRHEHRLLDGQRVPVGESFEVNGMKIEYPADPKADSSLIYNCRCTLVPVLKGFEVDSTDLSLRNTNKLGDMTYDEWKESHETYSDPITKQDQIENTMKNEYNNEYRRYAGEKPVYFNTKGYAEDNFDRKISIHDYDADLKAVNPNYGKKGYSTNCQRCCPTYLLRTQGFNVVANPDGYGNNKSKEFVLHNAAHSYYRTKEGKMPKVYFTRNSKTFGKAEIEQVMMDLDDGAMFEISCAWKDGGNHVFIAEKRNGVIRYVDPQTGSTDASNHFNRMKEGRTVFWRIDGCTIDEEYLPMICSNKGEHNEK